MDVTVMEYLLALAREGSLTKAAEPFFISPSALSQRLARAAFSPPERGPSTCATPRRS